MSRVKPNILITGTPGCGKTTTATMISDRCSLKHLEVSSLIKSKGYHGGRDDTFDTLVLDEESEEKLLDEMEIELQDGGVVVDFHGSDLFPERWFDLVICLRTDNTVLFDRLTKRGYPSNKITENVECEIMQVVLEEARGAYASEIVHERNSNTIEDMERNVDNLAVWIEQFIKDNQ
jgi:adenylate kinase